jgi:hypothetical protein
MIMAWLPGPRRAPTGDEVAEAPGRVAYLDNLKAVLIAGVIFGHAWAGYVELGSWTYGDIREVSIGPAMETVLEVVFGPFGLFVMGFFFLMAGLLTPKSLSRKGPGLFARDRLVRLGVPLVVFTFVLWPPVVYAMDRVAGHPRTYRSILAHTLLSPDPVHLWFVEVLLLYSLGYAAWRWLRPVAVLPADRFSELRLRHIMAIGAGIAGASFLIRLRFPLDSSQFAQLHLWQWPQYLALFGLGLASARRGWLNPVPDRLRRDSGIAALVSALAIGVFAVIVAVAGIPTDAFLGGWNLAAAVAAAAEGVLAVTLSVWLFGAAQRQLNHRAGAIRAAATRGAYTAFLVQAPILVALALTLRPWGVPAEAKALVVSVFGVVTCFALGAIGSVAAAGQPAQLGDPGGADHGRHDRHADSGDEQRQSQRQAAMHPEEADLDAAGVLQHEDDKYHEQQ